jgi:hypothetical protein
MKQELDIIRSNQSLLEGGSKYPKANPDPVTIKPLNSEHRTLGSPNFF